MPSSQFVLVLAASIALSFGAVPPSGSLRATALLQVEPTPAVPDATGSWLDKTVELARRLPLPFDVRWLAFRLALAETEGRAESGQPPVVSFAAEQQTPWVWAMFLMGFWWFVFTMLVWIILIVVIAHFYIKSKQYPEFDAALANPESQAALRTWSSGFCACYEDCQTCWCAFCCPAIRWAETLSLVNGLLVFWVGFTIYLSLSFANLMTSITLLWLSLVIICTAYRQELRAKFNFERQGGCSIVTDCLLYTCCTCCAIVQEARHVESAIKYGHPCVKVPIKEPSKE